VRPKSPQLRFLPILLPHSLEEGKKAFQEYRNYMKQVLDRIPQECL